MWRGAESAVATRLHQRRQIVLLLFAHINSCAVTDCLFCALPSRPGCLVLTKRVAITGSRTTPPPLVAKTTRTTSRTTRPTARGGKMCETRHKRTSADRDNFAHTTQPSRPCLQLSRLTSAARLKPWEIITSIKTLSIWLFWGDKLGSG